MRWSAKGRAVLEAAEHEVVGEADAPTAALADLLRLKPELLLLDLQLGARSGLELLAEIGRRAFALRVIVLSMFGAQLHLSPKTVDTYRSRLMAKLDLGDVPAPVRWAIRQGLVPITTARLKFW